MGQPAVARRHRAPRRLRHPARPARHGHRRRRPDLRRRLLRRRRALTAGHSVRRVLHPVRRCDARPRRRRRRVDPVRLLGADVRAVVPPDRPRRPGRHGARRCVARFAGDRRRRPGHARRVAVPRAPGRLEQHRRGGRGRAALDDGPGRPGPRARRGVLQVGPVPVALLAPRGDGRTDPRQRLPALGDDGQGRCRPHRPLRAGCRRAPLVAPAPGDRRRVDDARRRRRRAAPRRRQAVVGLRHRLAARLPRAARRRGQRGGHRGRRGLARRPRPVQVRPVPVRRRGRSCDGEPRSAPAVRCRPGDAGDRRCSRAVHAVDGRPPAAARLRRQGIGARRVGSRWRMGPCRPGRRRDRLGADDGVLAAPVVGPVRDQARRRRAGHGPPPQRCAGRRPDRRPGRRLRAARPRRRTVRQPAGDGDRGTRPGRRRPPHPVARPAPAVAAVGRHHRRRDRARRADLAGTVEAGADADRRRVRLRQGVQRAALRRTPADDGDPERLAARLRRRGDRRGRGGARRRAGPGCRQRWRRRAGRLGDAVRRRAHGGRPVDRRRRRPGGGSSPCCCSAASARR